MNKKHKMYLRLNLVSIFFIAVSFISLTLAWFVYSGLSTVHTEVNVKAWYIEMEKNGEKVSNDIIITMDDIYPGMETLEEEIKIKNLGDSDAQVNYNIKNVRILDKTIYSEDDEISSEEIEDKLAHEYPFHINIDISKKFVRAKTDETIFKVSISWPLDSKQDEWDSSWGTQAYNFKKEEQDKKNHDKNYQILAPIKLDISLTAEQYIETPDSSDMKYRLGREILYDVNLNKMCTEEEGTCIRTNVIDANNTETDGTVTLLPKIIKNTTSDEYSVINDSYIPPIDGWKATTRILNIEDVLKIISKDITSSVISYTDMSDLIIGNVKLDARMVEVINSTKDKKGYFKFLNKFTYLYSNSCFWLSNPENKYGEETIFMVQPFDEETMKISFENKLDLENLKQQENEIVQCKTIPVIIADKANLEG